MEQNLPADRTFRTSNGLYCKTKGKGVPILGIHGIISDSTFFDGYFEEMQRQASSDQDSSGRTSWQMVSFDRRGYGHSTDHSYQDYSVDTQAEDAAEVLRLSVSSPAILIGHSAGSIIALALTLKHPELVRGLILIEPALPYSDRSRERLTLWNQKLNDYKNAGKSKKALVAFTREITPQGNSMTSCTPRAITNMQELKQTYQNLTAFMNGELNEIQTYAPEVSELRSLSIPAVIAVSEDGRETLFGTAALDAAAVLNWPVLKLPGNHNCIQIFPAEAARETGKWMQSFLL